MARPKSGNALSQQEKDDEQNERVSQLQNKRLKQELENKKEIQLDQFDLLQQMLDGLATIDSAILAGTPANVSSLVKAKVSLAKDIDALRRSLSADADDEDDFDLE